MTPASHMILTTVLLAILDVVAAAGPVVRPSCDKDAPTCEFSFVLGHHNTMLLYPHGVQGKAYPVRVTENGTFFKRHLHNCTISSQLTTQERLELVMADGFYKNVLLYNGALPGPPIVVYEGQQIVVHLRNEMVNAATTLHFHGILQHNTPWMDGAGRLSQCPISPGETFTYRFLADPVGTQWYHSHYGTQRTMGASGPLIILPKSEERAQEIRGDDPLPSFAEEYFLQVTDWMLKDSFTIYQLVRDEAISYIDGYDIPDRQCFDSTKQSDGLDCGVLPFHSGLINGKGRKYNAKTDKAEKLVPLEEFPVEKGRKYRFRAICASMTFGFRISIDGHSLHVIATDGNDIKSIEVESLVVFSGERFDFWIEATDPQDVGAYWIRAETLERFQTGKPIQAHHVEAILRYTDRSSPPNVEPTSTRNNCTESTQCDVLNCPFQSFLPDEHLNCISLTDARSTLATPTFTADKEEDFVEHFLNFHFAYKYKWESTVNGIQHVPSMAPPQIYPGESRQQVVPCDMEECTKTICRCTHKLDIPLGKIVQLVFVVTTVQERENALNGMSHQIHLHGHQMQVIKIGYPTYNTTTGFYEATSPDLACDERSAYCNQVRWADVGWSGGHVPGIVSQDPPMKDTVAVPAGGYVVVRIKATNPGFWFLHCHTEFHNEEGMALYLQVGDTSEMNAAPPSINTCGKSTFTNDQFLSAISQPKSPVSASAPSVDCTSSLEILLWVTLSLGTLCLFLIASHIAVLCHQKLRSGYMAIPTSTART